MPIRNSSNEWPLEKCKVREAWALALPSAESKAKGEGIVILHPDTGSTQHPEVIKGGNYVTSGWRTQDFFGWFTEGSEGIDNLGGINASHGTKTASVINSMEGHPNTPSLDYPTYAVPLTEFVTGIAPLALVIPHRVTDFVVLSMAVGSIDPTNYMNTYRTLARSIHYAISNFDLNTLGVISISLGGLVVDSVLNDALLSARRNGVIICAAGGQGPSGNSIMNTIAQRIPPGFPARSPLTVGVGGCDDCDNAPPEAFYGAGIDITAPGWGVKVAKTERATASFIIPFPPTVFTIEESSGTSYSTAFTAGACALWQAYHGRVALISTFGRPLLLDVFKYCLRTSARVPDGWDINRRGAGILDVEALLLCELPSLAEVG